MSNEIKEILYWFYDEYPKEEKILEKYLTNLQEENERLNNIINELEKWLSNEIKRIDKIQNDSKNVKPYGQEYNNYTFIIGCYDNVLDKLKDLKESKGK